MALHIYKLNIKLLKLVKSLKPYRQKQSLDSVDVLKNIKICC